MTTSTSTDGLGRPADPETGLPVGNPPIVYIVSVFVIGLLTALACFVTVHAWPAPEVEVIAVAPTMAGPDGAELYSRTCSACHGQEGEGRPGLGKDMRNSPFINDCTDQALLDFVKKGREAGDPLNTTKVPMPPKGGNPDLTDGELMAIVKHVRDLGATN